MPARELINRMRSFGFGPTARRGRTRPALWRGWVLVVVCLMVVAIELPGQIRNRARSTRTDRPLFENGVLVGWFHGGSSDVELGGRGLIRVKDGFWLKRFRNGDTNDLEMLAEGPNCLLDTRNQDVSSDEAILIHGFSSGESHVLTTNLVIAGRGFSTQQSNSVLIIWSDVRTEVLGKAKPEIKSPGQSGSNSQAADQPVVIHSEFFQFYQRSHLANYRGHVRATQAPYTLECPVMDVRLGDNNSFSNTVAEGGVVITDEKNQGRATGSRAVYEAGSGLMNLTGEPHWQDALGRQVWAREFVFDRELNAVFAKEDAHALLPGNSMGTNSPVLPGASGMGRQKAGSIYDIRAGTMQLDLGGGQTNAAGAPAETLHHFAAHHHVVMTNEIEQSWATGDDAVFTKETGVLRLVGHAKSIAGEDEVEGDVIEANRDDRTLSAHGQSMVRVPSRAVQGGRVADGATGSPQARGRGVIEIRSDDFNWKTNVATFRTRVHGVDLEKGEPVSRMDSDFLQLTFDDNNHIRALFATGKVVGDGFPANAKPSTLHASCEQLEVFWYPGGAMLKRIEARGDVRGEQAVLNLPDKEIYRRGRAGMLWLNFSSLTNRVETGQAQTNVFWTQMERDRAGIVTLRQSERGAKGERADYQVEPAGRGLVLTGHPLGWMETTNTATKKYSAQILTNADSLLVSPATGKLRGNGPNWEFLPVKAGQLPR